jgi:hypothetical protein
LNSTQTSSLQSDEKQISVLYKLPSPRYIVTEAQINSDDGRQELVYEVDKAKLIGLKLQKLPTTERRYREEREAGVV